MEKNEVIRLLRFYDHIDDEIRFQKKILPDYEFDFDVDLIKRDIAESINRLEYIKKDSIWQHYVDGVQWWRIKYKHNYSDRQIRNIASDGLIELGSMFEKSEPIMAFVRWRNLVQNSDAIIDT